jgi:hypothetical protein
MQLVKGVGARVAYVSIALAAIIPVVIIGVDLYLVLPSATGLSLQEAYASFPAKNLWAIVLSSGAWIVLTLATAGFYIRGVSRQDRSARYRPFSLWRVGEGVAFTLGVAGISASVASVFVAMLVDPPGAILGSSWKPFSAVLLSGILFWCMGLAMWAFGFFPPKVVRSTD